MFNIQHRILNYKILFIYIYKIEIMMYPEDPKDYLVFNSSIAVFLLYLLN
jgi:hypothetical protein